MAVSVESKYAPVTPLSIKTREELDRYTRVFLREPHPSENPQPHPVKRLDLFLDQKPVAIKRSS